MLARLVVERFAFAHLLTFAAALFAAEYFQLVLRLFAQAVFALD